MMNKRLRDAFNRQINRELYSAYLYMSMAAYFESIHMKGFAHWMQAQVQEELTHAMRMFDYLANRDTRIELQPIEAPPINWPNPVKVFDDTLTHERAVTGMINDLVRASLSAGDQDAVLFLKWYVDEQVEEEEHATEALAKTRRAQGDDEAMLLLDRDMAKRPWPGKETVSR